MINQKIGSGPEDFSLDHATLLVDDVAVTPGGTVEVDPLTSHIVALEYKILNADPWSPGDPWAAWMGCVTVFNVTDAKAVGSKTKGSDWGTGSGTLGINVGTLAKATQFRVKLWANQKDGAVAPPSSYW